MAGVDTGEPDIFIHGIQSALWSSTPDGDNNASRQVTETRQLIPNYSSRRSLGMNVRCIKLTPSQPIVPQVTCLENQVRISATPFGGDTFKWYSTSQSQTPIATDTEITIAPPTSQATYYLATYNTITGAESLDRLPIVVSDSQCGYLQDYTMADAATLTPCTTTECPAGSSVELIDQRDDKQYTVRLMPDGNLWMVDNLAYGGDTLNGGTDACAGKYDFDGNTTTAPTDIFGPGTYGDCRGLPDYSQYLYNWQAVMQAASAAPETNYTGSQENVTGICPAGWVLPTGGVDGDFVNLSKILGSNSTGGYEHNREISTLFLSPDYFNLPLTGVETNSDTLFEPGTHAGLWSSTQDNNSRTYRFTNHPTFYSPNYASGKANGFSVRCIKKE